MQKAFLQTPLCIALAATKYGHVNALNEGYFFLFPALSHSKTPMIYVKQRSFAPMKTFSLKPIVRTWRLFHTAEK
jgi:hypothetical protein